jgi:hypothetical protein
MEEQAGKLTTAAALFKLSQQTGGPLIARPTAARRAPAPVVTSGAEGAKRPTANSTMARMARPAKTASSGGEEWTEF